MAVFLQYGAAKVTPCAPKGGTKDPQASHIEPVFRLFFATSSPQTANVSPRPPQVHLRMPKTSEMGQKGDPRPPRHPKYHPHPPKSNRRKQTAQPKRKELQRTMRQKRATQAQQNLDVRRCRVSVLNNLIQEAKLQHYLVNSSIQRS